MSGFMRSTLTLGLGNVVAQAINVVAIPVITRLYSPQDYGVFAVYMSITLIIAPATTLQYDQAILLPRDDERADAVARLALACVLFFALLLAPAVLLSLFVSGSLRGTTVEHFWWVLPAGLLVLGAKQVVLNWSLRDKRFRTLAHAAIGESVADRTLVLGLGAGLHPGPLGLIAGRVLGPVVSTLWLFHPKRAKLAERHGVSVASVASRYRDFPRYSSWAVLLSSASRETPTLLLAALFSPAIAGFYALGQRVMNLPMSVVGDAISRVYRQRAAADLANERAIGEYTLTLFGYLLLITLPPAALLMFFGPQLFSVVFGARWVDSGAYVQILMLAFVGLFLHRVLGSLFDVLEKQRARLGFDMSMFVGRVGGLALVAYLWHEPKLALLALLAATLTVYSAAFTYIFRLVGVDPVRLAAIVIGRVAAVLPLVCAMAVVKLLLPNSACWQLLPAVLLLTVHMVIVVASNLKILTSSHRQA